MGRGNRDKRSFQKSETIGWDRKQSLRNYSLDIERKRPTRDQAPPPTFPNVDVHRADRDRPARLGPHGGVEIRVRGRRRHVRIFGWDLVEPVYRVRHMEYTVLLVSYRTLASTFAWRVWPRLYYVSTVPAFCGGFATVLLAVHRFAVAASLGIRTASLPLEQPSSPRRYCSTFKGVRRGRRVYKAHRSGRRRRTHDPIRRPPNRTRAALPAPAPLLQAGVPARRPRAE